MKLPLDLGSRLSKRFGLDPGLCQGPGLRHAVEHCQGQWDLPDAEAFFEHLRQSEQAFDAFTEGLLIPESWFFRDRAPFIYLRHWLENVWLPQHPDRETLKVLSLPCAAGQEPYSIAITLMEAGLPTDRFSITAGDLSMRSIEQAKLGRYRAMAFRGEPFCDYKRYFEKEDGCHLRVRESVRQRVEFSILNLLEPEGFARGTNYDVIFSRNVLIYFDSVSRRNAVKALEKTLAPNGLICVGHADGLAHICDDFVRSGPPAAFCFQRKGEQAQPEVTLPLEPVFTPKISPLAKTPAAAKAIPVNRVIADGPAKEPELSEFEEASALANIGELTKAESRCRNALGKQPDSVELMYLLAEISVAANKAQQAEPLLRRVVYLEPGHTDALFRLSLLAEKRGDKREAANWRRRATKRQLQTGVLST